MQAFKLPEPRSINSPVAADDYIIMIDDDKPDEAELCMRRVMPYGNLIAIIGYLVMIAILVACTRK
jgi:hypothetical protein